MSIGETLAEARRQAGLTITQVSQQTRIRESIIRSIEQGDFSPCGGDFYARGHIRSIAEVVGVDPAPLIRQYDEEHPSGGMRASQIFQPSTPIKIREPRSLHLGRVLAVALLAVVGFGAYRLYDTYNKPSSTTQAATVRPVVTVTATPTITPAATPSQTAPPPHTAVIRLTAVSDCWIGITSVTGQQLFQGVVKGGHSATWDEQQPVSMVIGNPPGVQLTVSGHPQQMNTVQVVNLRINPLTSPLVSVG